MDHNVPGPSAKAIEIVEAMEKEKELTNKFLSGQLSFADYSSEWYENDEEDEEGDAKTLKSSEGGARQSVPLLEKTYRGRKLSRLSAALLGLMGEANLRFVRGDKVTAEKMCNEIIKQVPFAPEPYQTLAQIYDYDSIKSLQYLLIAAHLSPPDANEWLRLADISQQMNDLKQELMCYTNAIRAEPHNLSLHLKRLELIDKMEQTKYNMYNSKLTKVKCYHKIVTGLPASESETIMKYARMAVSLYHNDNEIERALETMATAYKKCSELFNLQDINILLELLISTQQYQPCIEIFVAKLGVDIEAEINTVLGPNNKLEEQTNYLNCTLPDDLPIDLKCKLLVCFIHLRSIDLVKVLLDNFLHHDVDNAGDLYMDVEEALAAVGHNELALQVLDPLIKHPNFNLGAVWLKHANCLLKLNRLDEAVVSFNKVLHHAPQHAYARRKLFEIFESQGEIEKALDILQQNYKYVVNAQLLHEQCSILKKYQRWDKYLEVGEVLLSKTFNKFRYQEEIILACKTKRTLIQSYRQMRGENPNDDDITFDDEDFKLSNEEEWELFLELLSLAKQFKKYYVMQRLAFGAFKSSIGNLHRKELEFYAFQASLLNGDFSTAFTIMRDIFIVKYPCVVNWNLFNYVVINLEGKLTPRFWNTLFQKTDNVVEHMFLGKHYLTSNRYIMALKCFLDYHEKCKDPFSALLIGITFLLMATQRTMNKHHNLILQGISYMVTYRNLRQCDQEVYYNIGRVYQMLSIDNLAIGYYEKVLKCGPIANCPTHGEIDLKKEAAFNLYILYKNHAPVIARKYMMEYLVIE